LSDSFEEIVAVVGTIVFSLPLPVSAVQILWINVISDGFPHLSLTVDPKEVGIMKKAPRLPKTRIVAPWMRLLIFIVSFAGGAVALILFAYYWNKTNDLALSRSVAFATLGVNSLVYVFSIRTLNSPFWKENPFGNKWLNLAVVAGLFFQILPFTTEGLRGFFEIAPLGFSHWAIIFITSIVMFIIIEFSKAIFRVKFNGELSASSNKL
jgi:Ca2+-transporting ATPase